MREEYTLLPGVCLSLPGVCLSLRGVCLVLRAVRLVRYLGAVHVVNDVRLSALPEYLCAFPPSEPRESMSCL
jgi:hypothetical protein